MVKATRILCACVFFARLTDHKRTCRELAILEQGARTVRFAHGSRQAPANSRYPHSSTTHGKLTMQQDLVHAIKSNPKYHELVSKRSSFGWFMAILMLVIYYGFILIIAYAPSFLAQPVAAGWTMTIGIPIGVGVILAAFALTGIFIQRANTVFDDLSNQIKEEVL